MFEIVEMLKQGGWCMIPLGGCSFVAATITIERAFSLRQRNVMHSALIRAVEDYAGETSAPRALAACDVSSSPLARVLEEVLRMRHLDAAQAREAMYAVGRAQVGRLERGLILLEIVAGISPLIGLLGTVLGMLTVFKAITSNGIGDPQVLSAGISKALITTIVGLCVGIPALAFHSWFSKRADDLAVEMEGCATRLIAKMYQPE